MWDRWGEGRGDQHEHMSCYVMFQDVFLNWVSVKELDILQVFSPLINVDELLLDCC